MRLNVLARKVLCLLDGTHDRAEIVAGLQKELRRQTIWFEGEGGKVEPTVEQLTENVESTLGYFFDQARLIG